MNVLSSTTTPCVWLPPTEDNAGISRIRWLLSTICGKLQPAHVMLLLSTFTHGHIYYAIVMTIYKDNPKWIVNAILQVYVVWSCRCNHGLKTVFPEVTCSCSQSGKVDITLDLASPQYAL